MKWLVSLMAVVLVLLAWWVRQPEPSPVWLELSELSAESPLTEPFTFTETEAEPNGFATLDTHQAEVVAVSQLQITQSSSEPLSVAATSAECPPFSLLEEHPAKHLVEDWLRNELLFYNWAEEHYLHQEEAAIVLEAQAGNALAMRALAIYYAAPMLRPEFAGHDSADIPAPEFAKARFWLYQAALHNVPMMFAFQAFTYQDELSVLERNRDEGGILPEPYYSEKRQLLITIRALAEFDLWVTPVLSKVRSGSPLGLDAIEFTADELQQVQEQLAELQTEWRFHRTQLGQTERIDIEMPIAVAEWFDVLKHFEQCNTP